jgi:hypothetical protein
MALSVCHAADSAQSYGSLSPSSQGEQCSVQLPVYIRHPVTQQRKVCVSYHHDVSNIESRVTSEVRWSEARGRSVRAVVFGLPLMTQIILRTQYYYNDLYNKLFTSPGQHFLSVLTEDVTKQFAKEGNVWIESPNSEIELRHSCKANLCSVATPLFQKLNLWRREISTVHVSQRSKTIEKQIPKIF